jgi:hypothetical protein
MHPAPGNLLSALPLATLPLVLLALGSAAPAQVVHFDTAPGGSVTGMT